jgi:hypothetical protein
MKLTTRQLKRIIKEELNEMLSPDLKAKLDSLFTTGDPADARSGLEFAEIYGIPITIQMISPFLMSSDLETVLEGIEMALENGIELQHSDLNPSYKVIKALVKDPNAHPEILNIYATHNHRHVRGMIARHPNTPPETLAKLGMLDTSMNSTVVSFALQNPNIPAEVLKHHANSIYGYWRDLSRNALKKRNIDIEPYQEPRVNDLPQDLYDSEYDEDDDDEF